jgi:lipid-binding SYLF domain-containing protein
MKKILKGIGLIAIISLLGACALAPVTTDEPLAQQLLVDKARIVSDRFIGDQDMQWARKHLTQAKGLLIIPGLYKGAWFVGGSGGRGVLMVRDPGSGEWVGPGFYNIGSVSLGLQFGGQKSEVVLMVMTQKGLERLYGSTSFKIGGETSVAAGPVGEGVQGAMSSLNVDYVSFARTKGAFIGIALDGAVVSENYEWNKAYYGKPVRPVDIFVARGVTNPNSDKLRETVARLELPQ